MVVPELSMIAAKSDALHPEMWLPFQVHSLDTAGMMERLFFKWLPESVRSFIAVSLGLGFDMDSREEQTAAYCRLLALLHDIGKMTPAFQVKIVLNIDGYGDRLNACGITLTAAEPSASPHTLAGEAILLQAGFPASFCEIIGTHHGKHTGDARTQIEDHAQNYYGHRKCNQQQWTQLWNSWIQYALQETGMTIQSLPEPCVPCQMLLTGLLIMADWLASNTDYYPYIAADSTLQDVSYPERIDIAWKKIALPDVWFANTDSPDWFASRFKFSPNAVQHCMMEIVSENLSAGIYVLEAPMGIGKTEAALASAEILAEKLGMGGIFFGLPTQATANGIFSRIHQWAAKCDTETHTIRLAHGMTDLNEEYRSIFHGTAADSDDGTVIVHEWFEGRKQALLADFVVATVDQFLLASLKQKHSMLRHLGLAGKVVIIDECHAYDAYMNVYLDHTLTWMGAYGVPVIILSATLPPQRREALIRAYLGEKKPLTYQEQSELYAYPVLTWTAQKQVYQRSIPADAETKEITVGRLPESELVQQLRERLDDGGCAAVIVNTVCYAQQLAQLLTDQIPDFEIICFHSRFIATNRAAIEQKLLARVGKASSPAERDRLIVVGTQVMEQSLDLDFDWMVTELCPMDLLLQRSGRLHRHNRERPEKLRQPLLSVLENEQENKIYDAWILQQTAQNLPEKLIVPACIPRLVSAVYDAVDEQDPLYQNYKKTISDKQTKADGYCINAKLLRNRRKNLLSDYLDDDVGSSKEAEASVRDTEDTIEVLVLQQTDSHLLSLVSGAASFDATRPLDEPEAMLIARERLRLPLYYSKYHFAETLKALTVMPAKWTESAWLKGELLLILDRDANAVLLDKTVHYSQIFGLTEPERSEQWNKNVLII